MHLRIIVPYFLFFFIEAGAIILSLVVNCLLQYGVSFFFVPVDYSLKSWGYSYIVDHYYIFGSHSTERLNLLKIAENRYPETFSIV